MSPRFDKSVADLIRELTELDEHTRIEAKTGSEISRPVIETVCAFSNEPGLGGGYILLGVEQDTSALWPSYTIVGVPNPGKLQTDLATQCNTMFNVGLRPEMIVETVSGKQVVAVFVPEVEPGLKPVFFKSEGLPKGAFRRVGSSTQHCNEDDLLVFYQDRAVQSYDATVIPDSTLSDLDPDVIDDYRKIRAQANPEAEDLRWSNEDLLDALGCISRGEEPRKVTVAGILLFGKKTALRRFFPLARVDYIRVPGREWVREPDEKYETIELSLPLIRLIGRTHTTVLEDLPKSFSLPEGELQRQDIPAVPSRVIREAIVNALMHRSYRISGASQIIRYANRIEIRNPGHSLVAEDRLGEPGSQTRNPRIAAVLHETRYAETKGTGIRVMREAMVEANLTPPTFESDREKDQFIATFLFHHFLGPEDLAWLAQFQDARLTDEEARALIFVRETGAIHNADYRDINRVDVLTASGHLRRLRDLGLLEPRGKGSATFYLPTPKLLAGMDQVAPAGSGTVAQPEQTGAKVLTQELPTLSQELGGLSQELEALPQELAEKIKAVGQRGDPAQVREVILALCSWKEMKSGDIAERLDRRPDYIVSNYLTPMLQEGLLELKYPSQPTHPNQAYRTAQRTS